VLKKKYLLKSKKNKKRRVGKLTAVASCILLLWLPGCSYRFFQEKPILRDEPGMTLAPAQLADTSSAAFVDEARLYDIFFPVAKHPVKLCLEDERKLVVCYLCELSSTDISALYRTGMECLGWDETIMFQTDQSCLIFEKPSKLCIVIIQKDQDSLLQKVSLYMGPKRASDF
jgi:hypothetical protein